MQVDDEWVVGLFEHFGFGDCVFKLLFNDQIFLLKGFESIYNPTLDMPRQEHLAKRPRSQHLYNLKRRKINLLIHNFVELMRKLILSRLHILLFILFDIHRNFLVSWLHRTRRPIIILTIFPAYWSIRLITKGNSFIARAG